MTSIAIRQMRHIPVGVSERILSEVESLAQEPDPSRHVKKLRGGSVVPFYSLRVGAYRAILNIHNDVLIIVVVEVGH